MENAFISSEGEVVGMRMGTRNRIRSFTGVVAVACLVAGVAGCDGGAGPSNAPATVEPSIGSDDQLRERLQYIADSGVAGSGLGGLPEFIEKHAKKAELMADYKKLQAAASPEQIKSIAKAMLGKL